MFHRLSVVLILCCLTLSAFAAEQEDLFAAVRINDAEGVTMMLDEHPDWVFSKDEDGDSLLDTTIGGQGQEVLDLLLERKCPVNTRNWEGNTPLFSAAICNDAYAVDALIAHGAKVDAQNDSSQTPLYYAASFGSADAVDKLIAHGANVNVVDEALGYTPLLLAARYHYTDTALLLLKHGADANAVDKQGVNALRYALHNADTVLADALRKKKVTVAKPGTLAGAIEQGKITEVRSLLRKQPAAVSEVDNAGWTPLHFAALFGQVEIAKILLDAGADLEATEQLHNSTPLLLAVRAGQEKMTALLLDKGADSDAYDDASILDHAVSARNIDLLNLLLEQVFDAKPNTTETLLSALITATYEGFIPAIDALIDHGAPVNRFSDVYGGPPISHALNADVTLALINRGADVNAMSPTTSDEEGSFEHQTPLHYAVFIEDLEMARVLLAHGALVNAKDGNGETPLQAAIGQENMEMVELLQKNGGLYFGYTITNPLTVFLYDGVGIVPLRYVAERLGCTVTPGPGKDNVTVTDGKTTVVCTVGQDSAIKDDRTITLAALVARLDDNTYVPASLFREFGIAVDFEPLNKELIFTQPGKDISLILPTYGSEMTTWSAFYLDCYAGLTDRVIAQLKAGEKTDQYDAGSLSPLHVAVMHGRLGVVNALLDAGADIEAGDGYNDHPLHIAAAYGQQEAINVLLAHGAQLEARNCVGMTPLLAAVIFGQPDLVRLLIDKGADVNATDYYGLTVLDRLNSTEDLTGEDREAIAAILIAHGAKSSLPDPEEEGD